MDFSALHQWPFAGLIFAFFSGLCVAMANLCMRKSLDVGKNTHGYLLLQLSTACLLATVMNPMAHQAYEVNVSTLGFGIFAGFCLIAVMMAMGKAMNHGPAGLSVAFINASSVVPPMLLAWLFGSRLGFDYDFSEALGTILVVVGLFWASTTTLKAKNPGLWIKAISIVFVSHVLLLMTFQYRSLLLRMDTPIDGFLIPTHLEMSQSHWFLPLMFLVAFLVQLRFCFKEARFPSWKEGLLGICGGLLNGLSVVLIDQATRASIGTGQIALVFPLYSVSILTLCSLWSQVLYKEQIKWIAIATAMIGIVLGM
jgi:hypothetical protein